MRHSRWFKRSALLLFILLTSESRGYATLPQHSSAANDGLEMRGIDAQGGQDQTNAGGNEKFGDLTGATMVRVPDQNTVLLGGNRTADDSAGERGVPILSRIPLIGRLFTSRSDEKEKKSMLVLVQPTTLSPEE